MTTVPADAVASPAADVPAIAPETTDTAEPSAPPAETPPAPEAKPAERAEVPVEKPLDITRKVLGVKPKTEAPAADAKTDKPSDAPTEPNGEEDAKLPFNKHPRWQKLKNDHDELSRKYAETETKFKDLEAPAESFRKIEAFLAENNLSAQEAATGYTVMAMMRNEPQKALAVLRDFVGQLERITGEALPTDLAEQVDQGAMTEDAARELSRTRFERDQFRTRADTEAEARRTEQQTGLRDQIVNAVTAAETQAKAMDPEWDRKLPLLRDRLAALNRENPARTAEAAVATFQRAVREVNQAVSGFAPKRVVPVPPRNAPATASSLPSVPVTASPKTGLDIVRGVLSLG